MKSSAAESISSATANRKQWCLSRSLSIGSVLEPGPISSRGTAMLRGVILAGGVLLAGSWQFAQFPGMMRYTFGERTRDRAADHFAGPLVADLGVICGYALILLGCAIIVSRLAASPAGGRVGRIAFGSTVIAVVADVLEDSGLFCSTFTGGGSHPSLDDFLTTATAAVATVKWCALLIAALAVPTASVVLLIRWRARKQLQIAQMGLERLAELTRAQPQAAAFSASGSGDLPTGHRPNPEVAIEEQPVGQWWTECRTDDASPVVSDEHIRQDNWTWLTAYNVPGAQDVIDQRSDHPVHAICLSGGGVRSASIAMGALQSLSSARPDPSPGTLKSGSSSSAVDEPAAEGPPACGSAGESVPEKFVDTVDYVISVSGGGYVAGARLLACKEEPTRKAGLGAEATRTESSPCEDRPLRISERFAEGSVEFEHIRRNSSYIADSMPSLLRALGYVGRNLIASVLILFWIPVALGLAGGYVLAYLPIAAIVPVPRYTHSKPPQMVTKQDILATENYFQALVDHPYVWWGLGLFAAAALALLARALCIEVTSYTEQSETLRTRVLLRMHSVVTVGLAITVLVVGLPALMRLCAHTLGTDFRLAQVSGTTAGVLGLQYLSVIISMGWRKRARFATTTQSGRTWRQILPAGVVPYLLALMTLAVLAVAWLLILGCVAAGVFGYLTQGVGGPYRQIAWLEWWILGTTTVILLLCVADVTSLSLHPFYRWRLANTFAVRRKVRNVAGGAPQPQPYAEAYPAAEPTWLHTHGAVKDGPKFVFCAAAALSGVGKPAPGLNAVSFALSADYIGGPELGWLKSDKLWAAAPPRLKRDLTVQAAVAVSGAAFASTMGRQNKGFQTLLAISGARLGTWLPNPAHVEQLYKRFSEPAAAEVESHSGRGEGQVPGRVPQRELLKALPVVRGFTYFYRELFAQHPIDARLVQITDGGHYENLGLVEALRRRARVIVCIDGGGDPPPFLSGLADATRLARSELGVEIDLDQEGPFALQNLTPGCGKPFPAGDAFEALNPRITKGTVVRGLIRYPAASGLPASQREGLLILAKAVVWESCSDWLLTYAGDSAIFPHDSTSDQWFTESQFAAYTELGRILGRSVIEAYNAPGGPPRPRLVGDDVSPE
jgi:hypothetical protein